MPTTKEEALCECEEDLKTDPVVGVEDSVSEAGGRLRPSAIPSELADKWATTEGGMIMKRNVYLSAKAAFEQAREAHALAKHDLGTLVSSQNRTKFMVYKGRVIKIEYRNKARNSVSWAETIS